MALLSKLKSILGIGGSRDGEERTDTSVTVEREATDRDGSDAETDTDAVEREAAEQDAADDADPDSDATEPADADETVAAGTDASASTGSMTDTDEPQTEAAAEPAEAAGPPTDPVDDEPVDRDVEDVIDQAEDADAEEETEPTDSEAVSETEDSTAATDAVEDDPEDTAEADLTAIKGIGPAYSDRLEAAGVSSVAELAGADAETLAAEIDVSPKIVADWIDRAADQ